MKLVHNRKSRAWEQLTELWNEPGRVNIIHYSCEGFYDKPKSSSLRIASIAVRNLESGQVKSFSVKEYSDLRGYTKDQLEEHYEELEFKLLQDFFTYAKHHQNYKWLHWNLRNDLFGFQALELRFRILKGNPYKVNDDNKYDLSQIFSGIYGDQYIENPHLARLRKLNNITNKGFVSGEEEVELFRQGEYFDLHRSTQAKVDLLARFCQLAYEGKLKTNSTSKKMNFQFIIAILERFSNNQLIGFLFTWVIRLTRGYK